MTLDERVARAQHIADAVDSNVWVNEKKDTVRVYVTRGNRLGYVSVREDGSIGYKHDWMHVLGPDLQKKGLVGAVLSEWVGPK